MLPKAHMCVCVGSRPAGRGGGWDDHADDDDIPVDRISRNPGQIAESEARRVTKSPGGLRNVGSAPGFGLLSSTVFAGTSLLLLLRRVVAPFARLHSHAPGRRRRVKCCAAAAPSWVTALKDNAEPQLLNGLLLPVAVFQQRLPLADFYATGPSRRRRRAGGFIKNELATERRRLEP